MLEAPDTWQYITTEDQLDQVVEDLEAYGDIFLRKGRRPKITVDLEISSKVKRYKPILLPDGSYESEVELFQIGLDPYVEEIQYLIDMQALNYNYKLVAAKLGKFITNWTTIGQRFVFDIAHLIERFKIYPRFPRCCMLLSQMINAGDKINKFFSIKKHGMASLFSDCFDWGWFAAKVGMTIPEYCTYKDRHQSQDWSVRPLRREDFKYGSIDTGILHYLYNILLEKMEDIIKKHKKPNLKYTYLLECEAMIEFAIMEIVGFKPNIQHFEERVTPYLEGYIEDAENHLMQYHEFWVEEVNETTQVKLMDGQILKLGHRKQSVPYCRFINVNSKRNGHNDGQLIPALARAGIKIPNTQKETFHSLLYDPENEEKFTDKQRHILSKVLQFLRAKSLYSKYGPNLYEGEKNVIYGDGRFHPDIGQMGGQDNGVDTQRTQMKNPALQTIFNGDDVFDDGESFGKTIKEGFEAERDKVFLVADWSNQEVRICTELTDDEYLKVVFHENRDQHAESAKEVFKLDYLPGKDDPMRKAGKTGFLGHQYEQGWKGMQQKVYESTKCKLWLSDKEAKILKEGMKKKYAGITKWQEKCHLEVAKALQDYDTLRSFENRRPLFIGFTKLKWDFDKLKDIFEIEGVTGKVELTRLRKWCLYIHQERIIKAAKKELTKFTIVDKSEMIPVLQRSYRPDPKKNTFIVNKSLLNKVKFLRKVPLKPKDTLSRHYKRWDKERQQWTDWGNEWSKRESSIGRELFNFLIQPEGSTMLKLAMLGIGRKFRAKGWSYRHASIVYECHDAIISEVDLDKALEARDIMQEVMKKCFEALVTKVPTPVDVGIGYSWSSADSSELQKEINRQLKEGKTLVEVLV